MSTIELTVESRELLSRQPSRPGLRLERSHARGPGDAADALQLTLLARPEELRLESWHWIQMRELRRLQLKEDFVFAVAGACAATAIGLAFLAAR